MRLQGSIFFAAFLAVCVCTLPTNPSNNVLLDDFSALPESGQIVFTPQKNIPSSLMDGDFFADTSATDAIVGDWKAEVVWQHNAYRAHYSAPPLSWSDALYPGTQQWANQCQFHHSDGRGAYGENLAAGTGDVYGFSTGLKSWMDEAPKYDYNNPGFSTETGHFTQVVWKSSLQVACAIANCPGGTIFQQPSKYVVCRYSPPGNFIGRFRENVDRYR